MTGPLAQQFARLWEALAAHQSDDMGLSGRYYQQAKHHAYEAALSAIERHVQDMENALAEIAGHSVFEAHASGITMRNIARAALSAREKEEE